MNEELAAELAAIQRLAEHLASETARLKSATARLKFHLDERIEPATPRSITRSIMKEDGTAAELYPPKRVAQWRGRDDEDDGSD